MDNHVNPSCFSPVNYLKILIIYISVKILQNENTLHLYTLPINQMTEGMHAVDYVQQIFQQSFDYVDNLEA